MPCWVLSRANPYSSGMRHACCVQLEEHCFQGLGERSRGAHNHVHSIHHMLGHRMAEGQVVAVHSSHPCMALAIFVQDLREMRTDLSVSPGYSQPLTVCEHQ